MKVKVRSVNPDFQANKVCILRAQNDTKKKQCSYQDFLHWGPQDPKKSYKGGQEEEKRVTIFKYS